MECELRMHTGRLFLPRLQKSGRPTSQRLSERDEHRHPASSAQGKPVPKSVNKIGDRGRVSSPLLLVVGGQWGEGQPVRDDYRSLHVAGIAGTLAAVKAPGRGRTVADQAAERPLDRS